MSRALAAALVLLGPAAAGAAGLEASLDVASRYSWRGIARADAFVLQPGLHLRNVAGTGLFARAWGSTALDHRDAVRVEDEVDLGAGIRRKLGPVAAAAAVTVAWFPSTPGGGRRTEELSASLQVSARVADLDLRPHLLAARDVGLFDATYLRAGVSPRLDFRQAVKVYPRAWVGFGDFGPPARGFGFQDAAVEIDVEWAPWAYRDVALTAGPRLVREEVTAPGWHLAAAAGVRWRKALGF